MEEIEKVVRKQAYDWLPRTGRFTALISGLICVENATSSGAVLSLEYLKNLRALADKYGVPVHMDGARLFNAVTGLFNKLTFSVKRRCKGDRLIR